MKILQVTTNYPTPEHPIFGIFVKEQVESLQKLGIDSDVFYCDGENKGFRKYITYVPKLWWKVLTGNYDIVHCHHALSAIIFTMTGWPLCKKCVLSYQNDPDREWGGTIFQALTLLFNAFIIKNKSIYLKYKKAFYLPNGCNADFFRPMNKQECRKALGLDPTKIYVLYMDSNKGVRTQKRKDRFDATLQLLRDKYGYSNLEEIALRNTPREKIPAYMNAIDFHLISSDFEGSPNSVKECVCCNTPVVSTDVGNVKEMIGAIKGCSVVEDFSAEALAKAADGILKRKEPFAGREKFLSKGYGMETVANKLYGIYKNVLKERD